MSTAYSKAIQIALSRTQPAGVSDQVYRRCRLIASDTRLANLDPSILPDSYSALYELSKMSTEMIRRLEEMGLITPDVSTRTLRTARVEKRVKMWVRLQFP